MHTTPGLLLWGRRTHPPKGPPVQYNNYETDTNRLKDTSEDTADTVPCVPLWTFKSRVHHHDVRTESASGTKVSGEWIVPPRLQRRRADPLGPGRRTRVNDEGLARHRPSRRELRVPSDSATSLVNLRRRETSASCPTRVRTGRGAPAVRPSTRRPDLWEPTPSQ